MPCRARATLNIPGIINRTRRYNLGSPRKGLCRCEAGVRASTECWIDTAWTTRQKGAEMDMNTLVLAHVRDTLGLERDQVFITGSRAIPGASTPESDYDIVVRVTEETYPVIRGQLWRLGHVQPFVLHKRKYEDGVDEMSTSCFYVESSVAGGTINILLKREVQFAAWQYATTRLITESMEAIWLSTDREYRVGRFKAWRQSFAAGAWAASALCERCQEVPF